MIRTSIKNTVEDMLRDYPNIDKYIKQREQELMYPIREDDDNVGGGKGNKISKPQEQMIITIDQDKRISSLEHQKRIISDCLDDCDRDTYTIVDELYFKKRSSYVNVESLVYGNKINLSIRSAYRKRNELLEKIAERYKLVDPY